MTLKNVNLIESCKQELEAVKNSLMNGIKEADKKEMINTLLLVMDDMKISDPEFEVTYHTHSINGHHESYLNIADMHLNRLYSDLEFIVNKLKEKDTNAKYIVRMLDKMIDTNMYLDFVQEFIDKTVLLQEGEYKKGILKLSDRIPGEYSVVSGIK